MKVCPISCFYHEQLCYSFHSQLLFIIYLQLQSTAWFEKYDYMFLMCFTGKPIFSVDIHPDGTKFATGGQGKTSTTVYILQHWTCFGFFWQGFIEILCIFHKCCTWIGFFFSGEDSGKVMIWNMAPVLREEDEKNENIPKMLCQMDNHLGNKPYL